MTAPLAIAWSRPLPDGAEPTTVTVSRDAAGRWFVSLLCQCPVETLPAGDTAVGVDAGITSLVTLSTGEKVTNPRHERRDRARLARAQRRLARTAAGSANRDKARLKVARVHARITDRRRDFLHQLTTRLVRDNQAVVIEDLSVRTLARNHHLAVSGSARTVVPGMTGISTPRLTSEPPGWRSLPAEPASDLPGNLPGRAADCETGTPAGDRRNPRPSGRGEVKRTRWSRSRLRRWRR
jgi:hypothetical protein